MSNRNFALLTLSTRIRICILDSGSNRMHFTGIQTPAFSFRKEKEKEREREGEIARALYRVILPKLGTMTHA